MTHNKTAAYQGVPVRAAAYIADNLVLFAVFSALHYLVFGEFFRHVSEFSLSFATHPVCLFFVAVYFAYFILLEGFFGLTPGKALFRIRVTREDGSACGWKDSLVRNPLRLVDGVLFYLVGIVLILVSDKKQRLGDRAAGTVIVRH